MYNLGLNLFLCCYYVLVYNNLILNVCNKYIKCFKLFMYYVWIVFNKNVYICICESIIEIDEDFLIDIVFFFIDKKFIGLKIFFGKIYNG